MNFDYYKNLDCNVAKRKLKDLENGLFELGNALNNLPEVPSVDVLYLLSLPAMNIRGMSLGDIGKELQIKHGIEAIPPNCELEHGAGLWKIIRDAMKQCGN